MSSKRRQRKMQCGHKRRYESLEKAEAHLTWLRRINEDSLYKAAYTCRWCGSVHIGTRGRKTATGHSGHQDRSRGLLKWWSPA